MRVRSDLRLTPKLMPKNKVLASFALLLILAVLAWAAGPTIQAGLIILNGTTLTGAAGGNMTFQNATDTVVGRATTDTLTHKTFNTAGAGNVFQINGTTVNAVSGSGSTAMLNTGPSLSASPANSDNSTKVSTTAFVKSQGYFGVYANVWTHTCAPAACASFGASPQNVTPGITFLSTDMTANAEWAFDINFGVEHDGSVDSPTNVANLQVNSVTLAGCSVTCAGASCNSGADRAWMHGRLKVLTTGAGGTAKVQCQGAFTGGSASGNAQAGGNVADTTFALDTTANRSLTINCTTTLDTERCHFYDAVFYKIN